MLLAGEWSGNKTRLCMGTGSVAIAAATIKLFCGRNLDTF